MQILVVIFVACVAATDVSRFTLRPGPCPPDTVADYWWGGFISLKCGDQHCIALRSDGHVYGWGNTARCQLATTQNMSGMHSVHLPGSNYTDVYAHGNISCAVSIDHILYCWGTFAGMPAPVVPTQCETDPFYRYAIRSALGTVIVAPTYISVADMWAVGIATDILNSTAAPDMSLDTDLSLYSQYPVMRVSAPLNATLDEIMSECRIVLGGLISCNVDGQHVYWDAPGGSPETTRELSEAGTVDVGPVRITQRHATGCNSRFTYFCHADPPAFQGSVHMHRDAKPVQLNCSADAYCLWIDDCSMDTWLDVRGRHDRRITALAAGLYHTCVGFDDGTAECIGSADKCQYIMPQGGDSREYNRVFTGNISRVGRIFAAATTTCFVSVDNHTLACSGQSPFYAMCTMTQMRVEYFARPILSVTILPERVCVTIDATAPCPLSAPAICKLTDTGHMQCLHRPYLEGNGSITLLAQGDAHTVVVTRDNLLCCRGQTAGCGVHTDARMQCVGPTAERSANVPLVATSDRVSLLPLALVGVFILIVMAPLVLLIVFPRRTEDAFMRMA